MGKVIMSGIVEPLTVPVGLPPKGNALNTYTWEQIRLISDEGQAANYFSVGDTKTITINGKVGAETISNLSIDVFILGFDHNASLEGSNKIHFQIGKISGVDVSLCDSSCGSTTTTIGKFTMNKSATNSGGWVSSHMRTTVLGGDNMPTGTSANNMLNALPNDLKAVMKLVKKYTDNTGGGSNTASYVTGFSDSLWLLSEFEVYGTRSRANSAEQNYQKQYDYYKAGNSKIKKKHNATTTAAQWLLRSPYVSNTTSFCRVDDTGDIASDVAYRSQGVAPCFAV